MKKILFVSMIAFLVSCGFNKDPMMKLSGEIQNIEDGKVYLNLVKGVNDFFVIDSSDIVNGKFEFRTHLNDTSNYLFEAKPSNVRFAAILENSNIRIEGDADKMDRGFLEVDVTGSYNDSLLKVANGYYYSLLNSDKYSEYKELMRLYETEKDIDKKWTLKDQMTPYQEELFKEVTKLRIEFIRNHSGTYAAASLMRFLHNSVSLNQLKGLFAMFPKRIQEADVLADTREEIEGQERMQPGKPAPDFTLKNPEDKEVSIADFKGKVVLVDFWASWCRPCRASFPHLKRLYEKYKEQDFEIIGVSNDTRHEAWKNAIKDDGVHWIQVVDEFPERNKPARVATLYAIHFLPTTYLIDRRGIILEKIESAEELDKKLKEIFGF